MARDHARIMLSIWGDDDWRELSTAAQHLYFVLLTQPSMNYAGVADWRPARLRALASDWPRVEFDAAAAELAAKMYIFPDDDTEEVLVRSFVKHDGLMKQKNMAVAMCRAYEGVASATIRGVIVHELRRLHESEPRLAGWANALHLLDNRSIDPSDRPLWHPSVDPSSNPSVDPSGTDTPDPSDDPPPTPTPSPTPNSLLHAPRKNAAYSPEFDRFWEVYPRREAKRTAAKAFTAAMKRADLEAILAGARRYRDDPQREEAFTKHPATWLNADGWEDEPLPVKSKGGGVDNSLDAWGRPSGGSDFVEAEVIDYRELRS